MVEIWSKLFEVEFFIATDFSKLSYVPIATGLRSSVIKLSLNGESGICDPRRE